MPLAHATLPGDLDNLLADDHAVVERRFQHLEAGRGDRRTQVDQIVFELALHTDAKGRVLYPAMAAAGLEAVGALEREQDLAAEQLLTSLTERQPGDELFERSLTELISATRDQSLQEVEHHLPKLRDTVGAPSMADLGEAYVAAKRAAPRRNKHVATDASGTLDPQAQRLLDALAALGPQPPEILIPEQARKQPTLVDAVARILTEDGRSVEPEPVGRVQDVKVPGPDDTDLGVRIYYPSPDRIDDHGDPTPIIYWIHGGGWVLFDVDTYDASCRGLANKAGAVVVSPDYRKAPEHVFPAAHDDVLAGYRWLRDNAETLGGHPGRIAIGGESVGGGMAAATCWSLHREGEALPASQVLVYPLTTAAPFGDSMIDAADARPLNRPLLSWMAMHAFKGVPDGALDPRVDPLSISTDHLRAMPPTLIISDDRDVLRDQGEEFGRNLFDAGVHVSVRRFEGMMHEFFGASAALDAAELAQQEAAHHVLTHLNHGR